MKSMKKAKKVKEVMKAAKKTRKAKPAPMKMKGCKTKSAPKKVRNKECVNEQGNKSSASLRYKSGYRPPFWYGGSKLNAEWNNGIGRYRIHKRPGDPVESSCGFSNEDKSKEAWRKATKLLVK